MEVKEFILQILKFIYIKKSIKNIQYLYESNRLSTYLINIITNLIKINNYMNFDQSRFKSFKKLFFKMEDKI